MRPARQRSSTDSAAIGDAVARGLGRASHQEARVPVVRAVILLVVLALGRYVRLFSEFSALQEEELEHFCKAEVLTRTYKAGPNVFIRYSPDVTAYVRQCEANIVNLHDVALIEIHLADNSDKFFWVC